MIQLVLLLAGIVTFLLTIAIQRQSSGGWPLFIFAYVVSVALVLAGFGVYQIPGLT